MAQYAVTHGIQGRRHHGDVNEKAF